MNNKYAEKLKRLKTRLLEIDVEIQKSSVIVQEEKLKQRRLWDEKNSATSEISEIEKDSENEKNRTGKYNY